MKKIALTLLLILLSGVPFSTLCVTNNVSISIKKKGSGGSSGLGHAPVTGLTVEMSLDNETGELTISAPGTINGCVYVYDLSGIQEVYSPELNTTVTLPRTEDVHIISLQGSNWYGEGKIVY